jgi:hypothetical protein
VEAKRVLEIPLYERPTSSLDLNPIENVWRILKTTYQTTVLVPLTLFEMKQAVQEEWDKLQPSDFNKYIDSMPERICRKYCWKYSRLFKHRVSKYGPSFDNQ